MENLNDYNVRMQKVYDFMKKPYPKKNGLACPVCGECLLDTDGGKILSDPPKIKVHCACGFTGFRIV